MTPLKGLIRIAQRPEGPGRPLEAQDSGIIDTPTDLGAVTLGIVERQPSPSTAHCGFAAGVAVAGFRSRLSGLRPPAVIMPAAMAAWPRAAAARPGRVRASYKWYR